VIVGGGVRHGTGLDVKRTQISDRLPGTRMELDAAVGDEKGG
jgi:hypothetical protein